VPQRVLVQGPPLAGSRNPRDPGDPERQLPATVVVPEVVEVTSFDVQPPPLRAR